MKEMEKSYDPYKNLVRQYFYWRALPFMLILLVINEYGEVKLTWIYFLEIVIKLIVAIWLARVLAKSWSNGKIKKTN